MDAKALKAAVALKKQKFLPVAIVEPFQRFFKKIVSGSFPLFLAAIIALVWANHPWQFLPSRMAERTDHLPGVLSDLKIAAPLD